MLFNGGYMVYEFISIKQIALPLKKKNNNPVTDYIISLLKTTHWPSIPINVKSILWPTRYYNIQPLPHVLLHPTTCPTWLIMYQEPTWPPCCPPTCPTWSYLRTLAHVTFSTWNALTIEIYTSQHHSFQAPTFLCSNVTLKRKFLDNPI